MQFTTVFHFLGWVLALVAAFMLMPALVAFVDKDFAISQAFLLSSLTTAFVGGSLILALKRSDRLSGPREGVLFLTLFLFLVSFFGAFPIAVAKGFPTFLDAWFEAISGLTTTGASLIENYEEQPKALFLWRALLQWIGGFFTVLAAAHILSRWGGHALPVRRPKLPSFGPIESMSGVFTKIGFTIPAFAIIYCSLTLVSVLGLWAGGMPDWEAICIGLSTVSSGGFSTRAGSISNFNAPMAEALMMLIMVFSAMNIYVHWQGLRGNFKGYLTDQETRGLIIALLITGLLYAGIDSQLSEDHTVFVSLFNATSLLTTSGYFIAGGEGLAIPAFAMLLPVLIGGAAISATGGLKIVRLGLLFGHSRRELQRLSFPHGSFKFEFNEARISDAQMAGVWGLFLAYISVITLTAMTIAGAGFDFRTSFAGAIAAVMNAGPLLEASNGTSVTYGDFPPYVRTTLMFAMIAGRVEILAFVSLFNIQFWRS